MTLHIHTRQPVSLFWKVFAWVISLTLILTGIAIYLLWPQWLVYRQAKEKEYLVADLEAMGIKCDLNGTVQHGNIRGLRFLNQEAVEAFPQYVAKNPDCFDHLQMITWLIFTDVELSAEQLLQWQQWFGPGLDILSFKDCSLPDNCFQLVAECRPADLILSGGKLASQLPLKPGTTIQVDNLIIYELDLSEENFLTLCQDSQLESLSLRGYVPAQATLETLAEQTPSPFAHLNSFSAEKLDLADWLPLLRKSDQLRSVKLSFCEFTAADLEQLPKSERLWADLKGTAEPESVTGLQNSALWMLSLEELTIDGSWDQALSSLPKSLESVYLRNCRITSIIGLRELLPRGVKITFDLESEISDADWETLKKENPERMERSGDF